MSVFVITGVLVVFGAEPNGARRMAVFRYCVNASNSLRNCSGVNGTNAGGTTLY